MLEVNLGGKVVPQGPKGDTRILMHLDGNGRDECGAAVTGSTNYDSTIKKFGTTSARFLNGGILTIPQPGTNFSNFTEATVECWLYTTGAASWGALFAQGTSSGNYVGIDCSQSYGSDLRAMWNNPAGGLSSVTLVASGTFPKNKWTHFAMTWKDQFVTAYVAGKQVSRNPMPVWFLRANENIGLGAIPYVAQYSYPGYVDEFRLSATCLYDADFTPYDFPFTL